MMGERAILISLQKSGTHLTQELMRHLGYSIWGESKVTPEIEPKLNDHEKAELRNIALSEEECRQYSAARHYDRAGDRLRDALDREAWLRVAWSWQTRLGAPVENRYGTATTAAVAESYTRTRLLNMRFRDTPAGICWIYHQLNVRSVDGAFLQEWAQTDTPKILLSIRDPRDVMLSFVDYLSNSTGRGYGNFSEFRVISETIRSLSTPDDKLSYALEDDDFPGHGDLRHAYWLYRHPRVCVIRFEDLIGVKGGGCREKQRNVIERVSAHVKAEVDADAIVDAIYNREAFTFNRGCIGRWREYYSERHLRMFHSKFGDILAKYDYE